MTRRISVSIAPDGTITAEVTGAPGPACLSSYETIGRLVPGASVVDSKLTPEYYLTATEQAEVRNYATDTERPS